MSQLIRVCQLYSDIMSTYGDHGNTRYLVYFLLKHNIQPVVTWHRYGEVIPEADIYLFGGGQDAGQTLISRDFQGDNGRRLRQYIDRAYCLAICGGYQLLGKYYIDQSGELLPGLDHLPIITVASEERLVGYVVAKRMMGKGERTIIGFENHSGRTYRLDDSPPLARVIQGGGNNGHDQTEGIIYRKTIGSYLHGPLLPRNPHLAYWWLKDLLTTRGKIDRPELTLEKLAHQSYLHSAG